MMRMVDILAAYGNELSDANAIACIRRTSFAVNEDVDGDGDGLDKQMETSGDIGGMYERASSSLCEIWYDKTGGYRCDNVGWWSCTSGLRVSSSVNSAIHPLFVLVIWMHPNGSGRRNEEVESSQMVGEAS